METMCFFHHDGMRPHRQPGAVVWGKVRGDPWWPAVVLGPDPARPELGWRRRRRRTEEVRCTFLQADRTYGWLSVDQVRAFRKEEAGDDRAPDYIVQTKR
jgi:hypothetical protein